MLYLFDNDFIVKIINFDLMSDCLKLYNIETNQIRILNTLKYKLKSLKKKYSAEIIKNTENFIKDIKIVDDINPQDYCFLSSVDGIDEGEAVLFINANNKRESLIVTGDKRSIKTICNNKDIKNKLIGLNGKILIFEQVLLKLIETDFEKTIKKISSRLNSDIQLKLDTDKTIKMIFSQKENTTKETAIEGLQSNINEIKQLDSKILVE